MPRAFGEPLCSVVFRNKPEDFIVEEQLIFEPEGEGEHVYLQIKKRNTNTQWLAKQLAIFSGIKQRDVSYAGLKDRNAVTTQWFSLVLHPSKEPDWKKLDLEGIEILDVSRHRCKLRPGMVKINNFIITLRDADCSLKVLEDRIDLIRQHGTPNYFGEQRFGHGGENIEQAKKLFEGSLTVKDRKLKGIYLSAARSYLFNKVLQERVRQGNWNKAIDGDCMILNGSNSFFKTEKSDSVIDKRISEFDIHPSGPLWGKGESSVSLDARQLEDTVLAKETIIMKGLESVNMKSDRRALRMRASEIKSEFIENKTIQLRLMLSSGLYATTLLREAFFLSTVFK